MKDEYLILVNRAHRMYGKPDDLMSVSDAYPDIMLRRAARQALQELMKAAGCGGQIVPVSGYRSQKEQEETGLGEGLFMGCMVILEGTRA